MVDICTKKNLVKAVKIIDFGMSRSDDGDGGGKTSFFIFLMRKQHCVDLTKKLTQC